MLIKINIDERRVSLAAERKATRIRREAIGWVAKDGIYRTLAYRKSLANYRKAQQ